jgi:SIR2-like domain
MPSGIHEAEGDESTPNDGETHETKVLDMEAGIRNLVNHLRKGRKLAILVGAGVSKSAGIPLGGEIVAELRSKFPDKFEDDEDYNYASVIEKALSSATARRVYFDRLCAGTRPELEHLLLAAMLDKKALTMILSTNFDHLLEMAAADVCERDVKVFLYNSRFVAEDLKDRNLKLVKLHGDFLFDDIANLEKEKQRHLNEDMRRKISAALEGSGLVVLGYSGGDRTIMQFLRDEACKPGNLTDGLWWVCHKEVDRHDPEVRTLLNSVAERKEAHFVVPPKGRKIYAADFLKAVAQQLGWTLPSLTPFQVRAGSGPVNHDVTFVHGTQSPPAIKAKPTPKSFSRNLEGTNRIVLITGEPSQFLGSSAIRRFGRDRVFYFDHRFSQTMIKHELVRDLQEFGTRIGVHSRDYSTTEELLDRLFEKSALLFINHLPSVNDTNYFVGSFLNFLYDDVLGAAKRARRGKLVLSFTPQTTQEVQLGLGGDPEAIRAVAPDPGYRDQLTELALGRIIPRLSTAQKADLVELVRTLSLLRFAEDAKTLANYSQIQVPNRLLDALVSEALCDTQDGRFVANDDLKAYILRHSPPLSEDVEYLARKMMERMKAEAGDPIHVSFEAERLYKSVDYFDDAAHAILFAAPGMLSSGMFSSLYDVLEFYTKPDARRKIPYFSLSGETKLWLATQLFRAWWGIPSRSNDISRDLRDVLNKGLGPEQGGAYVIVLNAMINELKGDYAGVERDLRQAESMFTPDVPPQVRGFVELSLATVLMESGPPLKLEEIRKRNWPEAKSWIDRSIETYSRANEGEGLTMAIRTKASLSIQMHDFPSAQEWLDRAWEMAVKGDGFSSEKAEFYGELFVLNLLTANSNVDKLKRAEGYYFSSKINCIASGNWGRLISNYLVLLQYQMTDKRVEKLDFLNVYGELVDTAIRLAERGSLERGWIRSFDTALNATLIQAARTSNLALGLKVVRDRMRFYHLTPDEKEALASTLSIIGLILEKWGDHRDEFVEIARNVAPDYQEVIACFCEWIVSPTLNLETLIEKHRLDKSWLDVMRTWKSRT